MVDVQAQLVAVQRDVQTTEMGEDATRVQKLAQEYPSPLADVWEAVTTPDRIRRWFLPVSGDLRLGGTYQLEGHAGGQILECEPPEGASARYRVTWAYGGGADTWLTVRLTATGSERTRLELEHVARVVDVPAELWAQYGPAATGIGWDSMLLGLALQLAANGSAVNPEEAAAWMAGEEGRVFAQGSGDAWAAAHVADGADADTAARAAAATVSLYTQPPEVPTDTAG